MEKSGRAYSVDDGKGEYLPDGRWRGTENLPDHGWTANLFNSRVHPNGTLATGCMICLVVFVVSLVGGLLGPVLGLSWAGSSLLFAFASLVIGLFLAMGG